MRLRKDPGFTLVELLVVVSILALVSSLAVPKIKVAFDSARQTQVAQDLKIIHEALERHYTDLSYYPQKLNDLIARGYLKTGARLKSPISGYWYFYAVDDNYDTEKYRARAYILGAPGRDAGVETKLYHGKPLPKGRRPDYRAYAWLHYSGAQGLNLYAADDLGNPIDSDLPADLATYRNACKPGSPTVCDVITN